LIPVETKIVKTAWDDGHAIIGFSREIAEGN
jgi:hypothetical protein